MKNLLHFQLKYLIRGFALGAPLFLILLTSINKLFGLKAEDMAQWGALSYLVSMIFTGYAISKGSIRYSDQWPLLLPSPRGRLLAHSLITTIIFCVLGLLHMLFCLVAYLALYTNELQTIAARDFQWTELKNVLTSSFYWVIQIKDPSAFSFFGAAALIVFAVSFLGNSKLTGLNALNYFHPRNGEKNHFIKEQLRNGARVLFFAAAGFILWRAQNLIPWALLFGLTITFPKLIASFYALSKRETLYFSRMLIHTPVAFFVIYFTSVMLLKVISPDEQRRSIASVYVHSLAGKNTITEHRMRRIADEKLDVNEVGEIQDEYHKAFGHFSFQNDFPVSFQEAIQNKKDMHMIWRLSRAFDDSKLTEDDATALLKKVNEVAPPKEDHLYYIKWRRFRPSESFALKLISSENPFERSFGIFTAINAPHSPKICAALIKAVKAKDLWNFDYHHLAESLSIQMRRKVSIAWALKAHPFGQTSAPAPELNESEFKVLKWEEAVKHPRSAQFLNVNLRNFTTTHPDYNYFLPREWIEPPRNYSAKEAFELWKRER